MFNGSLPVDTALGNAMPNLQGLRLLRNNLWGEIPPRLFNSCSPSLQELDLSWNSFWGSIPSSVGNCSSLKVLSFSRNYLSGYVPGEIGSLFQLESLILGDNNLSAIAQELGSLTKLTYLDLKRNIFSGKIPDFIFQLTALQYLWLNSNNFSGTIPPELFQTLTTIRYVDLSNNALVGDLPQTLWNLTSLRALLMARNALTGSIPEEIGNLEGLQVLDLSFNSLNGSLPSSIGKLKKLLWLMISNNSLTGPLPNDIANCSSLLWLNAAHNRLSGPLPDRIGDIGNGAEITFSENGANNSPLPDNAGDCSFIERWLPTDDGFNYNIQYSIMDYGACAAMWNNFLGGRLVLGGSSCLTQLNFTTSAYLQLSNNEIVGSIPKSLASFTRLSFLLLGDNNLTGNITQTLGTLPLLILNLSSNQLDGSISPLLGNLTCLSVLDMSSNNISGEVPMELENLGQLYSFNVSFNPELEGPIPKGGRFPGFQLSSYLGDVKLCFADGVIRQEIEAAPRTCPNNTLKLNTEPVETRESSYQHKISKPLDKYMTGGVVAGLAVAGLVVVIGAVGMWANFTTFRQKQGPASRRAGSSELDSLMAYHKHAISEKWHVEMYDGRRRGWLSYADLDWATCNFNDKKLAGKGSHAEVYKANLGGGVVLAVKLIEFHSGNKDDFLSHVRHIASLHHPNLLPVIGYFSRGPQHLLLSPFMQRGSLQDLLRDSPSVIDWQRTLSIAHGVASALAYLHDDCKPQNTIVHGSVKPSNILLDGLFKPYLADTALDRAVPVGVQPWQAPVQSYYAAPEHAPALEPAPEGDVYSFGLVLLELATRKTHQETAYGLVKRARRVAMGERSYDRDDGGLIDSIVRRTCADVRLLFRFLRVGLLCTHDDASCRPSMDDVAKYLSELKTEEDRSLPCIYAASA
ncbi:hypothetical protein KP509_02G024000 [Ceratopteris richardii]|nr:hypothetical protein KP509_02G024000 [Ceratopteris richardii]